MPVNKLLKESLEQLEKLVNRKDYNEANAMQGYTNGIIQFNIVTDFDGDITRYKNMAKKNFENELEQENFGMAAYWQAFLNGLEGAEMEASKGE